MWLIVGIREKQDAIRSADFERSLTCVGTTVAAFTALLPRSTLSQQSVCEGNELAEIRRQRGLHKHKQHAHDEDDEDEVTAKQAKRNRKRQCEIEEAIAAVKHAKRKRKAERAAQLVEQAKFERKQAKRERR